MTCHVCGGLEPCGSDPGTDDMHGAQCREEDVFAANRESQAASEEPLWVPRPVDDVIREHVERTMASVGGNKSRAAKLLGIDRRTLYRWLERKRTGHCRAKHVIDREPLGGEPPTDV